MGITLREILYDIGGGDAAAGRSSRPSRRAARRAAASRKGRTARPPGGFRRADEGRLDDGLRRHDRHGRGQLHGRRGPSTSLHFLVSRVVRKVLPCREGVRRMRRSSRTSRGGKGQEGDVELLRDDRLGGDRRRLCALGQQRPESGPQHHPLLPRRVRCPHPRQEMPGRGLQGADQLRHRCRSAPAARAVREGLPGRRGKGRCGKKPTPSTRQNAPGAAPAWRAASLNRSS